MNGIIHFSVVSLLVSVRLRCTFCTWISHSVCPIFTDFLTFSYSVASLFFVALSLSFFWIVVFLFGNVYYFIAFGSGIREDSQQVSVLIQWQAFGIAFWLCFFTWIYHTGKWVSLVVGMPCNRNVFHIHLFFSSSLRFVFRWIRLLGDARTQ